uniref:ATP-dependent DNA helicase n=1 Tax=Sander lucioperca TaxID=283035 RepID=A0A8C9XAX3_SANLU
MCLATFASEYRQVYKNESSKPGVITLDDKCGFVRKRTDVAVVRYARFSPTNQPEKHYQSLLQLFLPHYNDQELKPPPFIGFEEFYDAGSISNCNGDIISVKEVVDMNRSKFEIEAEKLEECEEIIESSGFPEDAWASLCPETESERLECLEEMRLNQPVYSTEQEVIPDLQPGQNTLVLMEFQKQKISHTEAQAILRSLNDLQAQVFYEIRQWCLKKVNGNNPEPFHVFISGGAGTGKSHLIKAVYYESCRLLARLSNYPDDVHVLLTAPTGVAAYNINATTIHHSFAIGNNVSLPYQPLTEEKVNTLRARLKDLQILVIDEISMVDPKLLTYIHGRLRQIKQCGDFSPFGNVSVIAVGRPLYSEQAGLNLWQDTFTHVELKEIVWQQNQDFAVTLSRIRKHKKGEKLDEQDEMLLKQCETGLGGNTEDLHIFATNGQVDMHNLNMLHKVCTDIVQIKAQDFDKNPQTGRFATKSTSHTCDQKTYLSKLLSVGTNARVMLIRNIDISDGLVNGVVGTVCLLQFDENATVPKTIYVNFDNQRIDKVTNSGGIRRQFPLRLAWACTIHKVQGLTLDKAVVSFKKIFSAGQAYVALSRVTAVENLIIQDFKASAIYAKPDIDEHLNSINSLEQLPQTSMNRLYVNYLQTCNM